MGRSCHTESAGEEGERGAIALRATNRAVSVPSDSCRTRIALYQWDKDKCEDKRVAFALKSTCGHQKGLSSR